MAAEIRPGVQRPDWSVVTQPAVREALRGRNRSRAGLSKKWIDPLSSQRDLAWRAVLELFGKRGRPPHLADMPTKWACRSTSFDRSLPDCRPVTFLAWKTTRLFMPTRSPAKQPSIAWSFTAIS
jgi:hypothetical protein